MVEVHRRDAEKYILNNVKIPTKNKKNNNNAEKSLDKDWEIDKHHLGTIGQQWGKIRNTSTTGKGSRATAKVRSELFLKQINKIKRKKGRVVGK